MFNQKKYEAKYENRVTIKTWPRQVNSSSPTTWLSTGHVALKTYKSEIEEHGCYVSFWPGICYESYDSTSTKPYYQCVCAKSVDHFHTEDEDKLMCQEPPEEYTITFNGLDPIKINAAFYNFKNSIYSWHIFGSSWFSNGETKNCAGLVFYLLIEGGIERYVSNYSDMFEKNTKQGIFGQIVEIKYGKSVQLLVESAFALIATIFFASKGGFHNFFPNTITKIHKNCIIFGNGLLLGLFDAYKIPQKNKAVSQFFYSFLFGSISSQLVLSAHLNANNIRLPLSKRLGLAATLIALSSVTVGVSDAIIPRISYFFGGTLDTSNGSGLVVTPEGITRLMHRAQKNYFHLGCSS